MTWSYTSPSHSVRDAVRFEIGDTVSTDPQLSDEEIDYILTQRATVGQAAVLCIDHLIAKYSRLVTQSVGSVSVSYGDRIRQFKELLARLRLRTSRAPIVIGGTSVSEKAAADEDTDRDAPVFKVGMFDRR